jgi:small subunit ribosomal protein S20
MANTKTAKKQLLNTKRNHMRNVHYKTMLKSAVKRARQTISAGSDVTAAQGALNLAVKMLYKTATRGVIKKHNASRRVSRIMRLYNKHFPQASVQA